MLARLETGHDAFSKNLADWLRRELPGFLTRDNDKALFNDLLKTKTVSATENSDSSEASS